MKLNQKPTGTDLIFNLNRNCLMYCLGLLLLGLVAGPAADAQAVRFSANTGDKGFDVTLADINVTARADLTLFKQHICAWFSTTEAKVTAMLGTMQPADVYLAFEVSQTTKKPVEEVIKVYDVHKGKGWGVVARELGIKPGSKEFHALKEAADGKHTKLNEKGKSGGKGKSGDNGNKGKGKGR